MSRYVLTSGHAHISPTYPLEDRAGSRVSDTMRRTHHMSRYVLTSGHAHISTTYPLEDRRVSDTKWTFDGHMTCPDMSLLVDMPTLQLHIL